MASVRCGPIAPLMLTHIPASDVPSEWATIGPALSKAIALDPERDGWRVLDMAVTGNLDFWRIGGSLAGWMVTQVHRERLKRALWVIYVAGRGGSIDEKRELMRLVERQAKESRCSEVRFEGRDWRKVFPDYSASQTPDGRWHFRKRVI
jgi:hypothetical protein